MSFYVLFYTFEGWEGRGMGYGRGVSIDDIHQRILIKIKCSIRICFMNVYIYCV